MTHVSRTLATLILGSSLLFAQLPNPLNLPDPLGITKKPTSAPTAPQASRERRGTVRPSKGNAHRNRGLHKGQRKNKSADRGEHRGHAKH